MTRTIQINYDLVSPGRNYERLYKYLKGFDGWDHLLESLWLVRTRKTAAEVRDDLKSFVDSNDKVAVFDVTGSSWATNFSNSQSDWLYGHMAAAA
jgi:hypothetical protein